MSRAAQRGQKYPHQIQSRVNAAQLQQIRDSASLAGMSVCRFIRHRATGSTVVSKQDAQLQRELNLIGNRLVYISKQGADVSEVIEELRAAIKKIQG